MTFVSVSSIRMVHLDNTGTRISSELSRPASSLHGMWNSLLGEQECSSVFHMAVLSQAALTVCLSLASASGSPPCAPGGMNHCLCVPTVGCVDPASLSWCFPPDLGVVYGSLLTSMKDCFIYLFLHYRPPQNLLP